MLLIAFLVLASVVFVISIAWCLFIVFRFSDKASKLNYRILSRTLGMMIISSFILLCVLFYVWWQDGVFILMGNHMSDEFILILGYVFFYWYTVIYSTFKVNKIKI